METWIIYAILASLSWGSYIIINKVAASQGINPFTAAMAMAIGIVGLFGIAFLATRSPIGNNWSAFGLSIAAGVVWGFGMLFALLALNSNAPVAKLTPIYNTNTLIAVLLGIILLRELPAGTEKIKVLIGAVLIIIGAVLVSS